MLAPEIIRKWREDPAIFVKDNFGVEPEAWQASVLKAFSSWEPEKIRITMKSAVGVGKSAVLSWCAWNFLSCYGDSTDHPKGAALSISEANLKDNLWAELSKWQTKSDFLSQAFQWTASRVFAKDHPQTWFLAARNFAQTADAETLGKTLSGLHSKYAAFIIDESGAIPVQVGKAAEQAVGEVMARNGFVKICQAGNPISTQGMLYASVKAANGVVVSITGDPDDPNASKRMDKKWAQDMIDLYGRNDAWVKTMILGLFPDTGINTLLGLDEVEKSMHKTRVVIEDIQHSQKRIGVDVARFGTDETVIFCRQGLMAFRPVIMRSATGPQIGSKIMNIMTKFPAERIFVDDTGGYGSSVVDYLGMNDIPCTPVNFGSKSDTARYFNKRGEMWFRLADWVKKGGRMPKDPILSKELLAATYTFKKGKLALEEKEMMRKRLGHSTDRADALCLTFSEADTRKISVIERLAAQKNQEYDPYWRLK